MTSLSSVSRIWPDLVRTLRTHATICFQPYRTNSVQRRFIPMAVLLDETKAYKPATASSQVTSR